MQRVRDGKSVEGRGKQRLIDRGKLGRGREREAAQKKDNTS